MASVDDALLPRRGRECDGNPGGLIALSAVIAVVGYRVQSRLQQKQHGGRIWLTTARCSRRWLGRAGAELHGVHLLEELLINFVYPDKVSILGPEHGDDVGDRQPGSLETARPR